MSVLLRLSISIAAVSALPSPTAFIINPTPASAGLCINRNKSLPSRTTTSIFSTPTKTSELIADIRNQISEDEDANLMMQALRGRGMNDDDKAAEGLQMQLIGEDFSPDGPNDGVSNSGLPYDYNPQALEKYFAARPFVILKRLVQLATTGGGFVLRIAFDKIIPGRADDPQLEVKRAGELRDLVTSLGPFYIKLGQALSIRPDVLSPRSMVELQKLCDKVPSYDSKIAFATIERELGQSVDELFSEITPEPVAAASLGQVYKATLRKTGETVAVKVQRPGVLETVSLDLFLARQVGLFARNFPALVDRLDTVALLDDFSYRFFQELDYNKECDNGVKIKEQMKVLPMVVIPSNYPEYTARRVHTAEWIEGEKLSSVRYIDTLNGCIV